MKATAAGLSIISIQNEGFGPRGFPSKNEGRGAAARHLFLSENEEFIPRGFPFQN